MVHYYDFINALLRCKSSFFTLPKTKDKRQDIRENTKDKRLKDYRPKTKDQRPKTKDQRPKTKD